MNSAALKTLLFVALAPAVFGQFGGPSLLSRGTTGNLFNTENSEFLNFRPFLGLSALINSGLTPVEVDPSGHIPNNTTWGAQASLGVYGAHRWRKSVFSVDYRGDFRHYSDKSFYDGSNQQLSMGFAHQLSRHVVLDLRQGGGLYGRTFGSPVASGFNETNPAVNPTSEIFDNRVLYLTSSAGLTWIKSARLSLNFSGSGYQVRRRSSSLFGTKGEMAHGDVAYRYSKRATISFNYSYMKFGFTKGFGDSDIHTLALEHSILLARGLELGVRAGAARIESKSLELIPVDPVITAITGFAETQIIGHHLNYLSDVGARLTQKFRHSGITIDYRRGVSPGNGVFATSQHEGLMGSYSYTGLKRWNVGFGGGYDTLYGLSQRFGKYRSYQGGFGVTRTLVQNFQFVARFDVRRFQVGTAGLERNLVQSSIGFSYSPGEVPLTLW